MTEKLNFLHRKVENIVGKGENAGHLGYTYILKLKESQNRDFLPLIFGRLLELMPIFLSCTT